MRTTETSEAAPLTRPQISARRVFGPLISNDVIATLGCPANGADAGSATRSAAASAAAAANRAGAAPSRSAASGAPFGAAAAKAAVKNAAAIIVLIIESPPL